MSDDPEIVAGWLVTENVALEEDDDTAVALLRMSAYPVDPGFGRMRCARNRAVWHVGMGPRGRNRRLPELQPDELRATLEWESGEKDLLVGDILTPERDLTESAIYSTDLRRGEVCPSCGKAAPATHAIRVRGGELSYRMLLQCGQCGHNAVVSGDGVPDEIEAELRAREGVVAIRAEPTQLAVPPATLAGAAEIDVSEARHRVEEAAGGAPLFLGSAHAAEVVAQRLENAGIVVRRARE